MSESNHEIEVDLEAYGFGGSLSLKPGELPGHTTVKVDVSLSLKLEDPGFPES